MAQELLHLYPSEPDLNETLHNIGIADANRRLPMPIGDWGFGVILHLYPSEPGLK
jgi:hypothetical protein